MKLQLKQFVLACLLFIVTIISTIQLPGANLEESLINHWRLNEGTGEIIMDSSPIRNLPGKLIKTEWCKDVDAVSLRFNGVDAFATTPEATSFYEPNGFTIDFRFQAERIAGTQYLICSKNFFVRLVDNSLNFGLCCGAWKELISDIKIEKGQWYRIALSFDGKNANVYINDQLVGKIDAFGSPLSNSMPLVLARSFFVSEGFFQGKISDIKIYNRVLSVDEIAPGPTDATERRQLTSRLEVLERLFEQKCHFNSISSEQKKQFKNAFTVVAAALSEYPRSAEKITSDLKVIESLAASKSFVSVSKLLRFYVINPFSNDKIRPDTPIKELPGAESNALQIIGTPGEFEAAGMVIRPMNNLNNLRFKIGNFTGKAGGLPASIVDIKLVKCWMQDGGAWRYVEAGHRTTLVPELLLNDPDFLTHRFDKDAIKIPGSDKKMLPIKDASALLPVTIQAENNQQFHVTIQLPKDTTSGFYQAPVELFDETGKIGEFSIQLKVLSFSLAPAITHYDSTREFTSSVYYWGQPSNAKAAEIGKLLKTDEQLLAEMENMARHGITSPILVWYHEVLYRDNALLRKGLETALKAGLLKNGVYFGISGDTDAQTESELKALSARVKGALAVIRNSGITSDVYFYASDEARGAKLIAQRPAINAIHEAGGKILVSGFQGIFDVLGDSLDLVNWYGVPLKDEAARWHGAGRRIWNYGSPQAGSEDAEVYRRNFGVYLWQKDYDGVADYCYADPHCEPFYRGNNFVYPTVSGVIDTLSWEGFREGLDDIRYASTLILAAKTAEKSSNPAKRKKATEAIAFLDKLDAKNCDLSWMRLKIIRLIIELSDVEK